MQNVRLSADLINQSIPRSLIRSLGIHGAGLVSTDPRQVTCPSHHQEGMCQQCRACWSRSVHTITYRKH